jgi:hypothetical protein
MPSKNKYWIQNAVNPTNKGALRRIAKVKKGETIPLATLTNLSHSTNATVAKRARLALAFRKMKHHKKAPSTNQ